MEKDKRGQLDINRVLREFRESEASKAGRKDALRIGASFDEAIKKILKAKPEPKKRKK